MLHGRPSLDTLHLWRLNLDDAGLRARGDELLDERERARAARFVFEQDHRRYVAAHTGLRLILSHYLDLDARALRFTILPGGKPVLVPGAVQFNISHAGEVGYVAIASTGHVGVDVELPQPGRRNLDLVETVFSHEEKAELLAVPAQHQEGTFLRVWTRKEAFLKAIGLGITASLPAVHVGVEESARIVQPLANISDRPVRVESVRVDRLEYVAVAGTGSGESRVECFHW